MKYPSSQAWKIKKQVFRLVLTAAILLLSGCQFITQPSLPAIKTFPGDTEKLSAFGWVGAEFTKAVHQPSVEAAFSITPEVKAVIFWQGNTFWVRPVEPFLKDTTYQAQIAGEIEFTDGSSQTMDKTWSFTIREPSLIYFDQGEIFQVSTDSSVSLQLSQSGSQVIEFNPERSGKSIAFITSNASGGQDVWVMDRDGENEIMLVACGKDRCAEPAWSIDGKTIAYTRESYQQDTNGYLPAQIWTVEVESGETSQLYQSDFAFGHSPSFSPDGLKFASYDTTQKGIRILDLQTAQESIVPRILPGVGDWSQDGTQILFTDVVSAENEPFVEVYIVDLMTNDLKDAFGKEITDTDFSQPRWMPGEEWLAASLRPVNANVNKALWVIRLEDAFGIPISEDPSATFSFYQWDPWGDQLVYQRLELTGSDPETSIWLWDWETRQPRLLVENGARPAWLP